MVGVRHRAGVGGPAARRVVGAPHLVVPDDVHDPEPAGHGAGTALGVGRGQPLRHRVGDRLLVGLVGAEHPVPRAALGVLGQPAVAVAHDAPLRGAHLVVARHQLGERHHAGLGLRVAEPLRLVGRRHVQRGRQRLGRGLGQGGRVRGRHPDGDGEHGDGQDAEGTHDTRHENSTGGWRLGSRAARANKTPAPRVTCGAGRTFVPPVLTRHKRFRRTTTTEFAPPSPERPSAGQPRAGPEPARPPSRAAHVGCARGIPRTVGRDHARPPEASG